MQKRELFYCDNTLCFSSEDFIQRWRKYEGRLDINSSKKLFFDISPGKKVIFSKAICDEGAETADDDSCKTLTVSQVERLKKAVQLYTDMEDMKQRANDLRLKAGYSRIVRPCGIELSNPVHEQKMKLYNTLQDIINIDETYAALQLSKLVRKE